MWIKVSGKHLVNLAHCHAVRIEKVTGRDTTGRGTQFAVQCYAGDREPCAVLAYRDTEEEAEAVLKQIRDFLESLPETKAVLLDLG